MGDFRNFLFLVWKHLGLPNPTEIQYDITLSMQHGPKRLVIEAFRGVGKSWIASAYVCFSLLLDPQVKILVVSASKVRADDFSTFTKRLIAEMPILAHLQAGKGQRDSNIAFDVGPAKAAHAPSVKSLGITSMLTGSRADIVIADDIEIPSNSGTTAQREKLSTAVKEFEALLTPHLTSRIMFLGTPQTEMSVYNELGNRGYKLMIWPARYPNSKQREAYKGNLAPYIENKLDRKLGVEGETTDPARFTDYDLLQRETSYGKSGFALQFMLDTSLSDADRYPLKLADLIVMDVPPDVGPVNLAWASGTDQIMNDLPVVGLTGDRYYKPMWQHKDMVPYQSKVMAIDPAGRGGDELAYCVLAHLNSRLFLQRWTGLAGGYKDENLEILAKTAKALNVNLMIVESNFGDGMFTKLLTPHLKKVGHRCGIEEVRNHIQKERRIIDTLEPVMNQHRLVVDRAVVHNDYKDTESQELRGFYQMTRITKERGALSKDDRIDVLSMAVQHFSDVLMKSTDTAEEDMRAKELEKELQRFHEHVFGIKHREPNASTWCIPNIS